MKALVDAGVDLFVAETMLSVDETVVALDAAQAVCDLPMICTLSLEADGSAMYGGNAVEAVLTLQESGCRRTELFRRSGSAGSSSCQHERSGNCSDHRETKRRHAVYR